MKAGRIDWEEARRRIDAADPGRMWEPGPEEIARILKERAQFLAKEIETEKDDEKTEILGFSIGEAHFALESGHVGSVHHLEQLTHIPCTPDFVTGIVNLRGEFISVVDVMKFFGCPGTVLAGTKKIIVLEGEGMRFSILADSIDGVQAISRKELKPPLSSLPGAEFVKAMASGHLVLLDAMKLLKDRRMIVEEEV